jgi:hypothetical protein
MSTNPLSEERRQASNQNSTNGAEERAVREDQNPANVHSNSQTTPVLSTQQSDHSSAGRSTGPRTSSGKERSKRNSLKHGIFAEAILLKTESHDEYESLVNRLRAALVANGLAVSSTSSIVHLACS